MADPLEQIDIVDEDDLVLYSTTKQEAHAQGLLHRCVIGLVINSNGDHVLVKQASDRQDAGQYVSPVGGHVKAGESPEDALRRETEEEIGLKEISFRLKGKGIFNREVLGRKENHYFILYEIDSDEEFIPGVEVESYKIFPIHELKRLRKENPKVFGDAHHNIMQTFYKELL